MHSWSQRRLWRSALCGRSVKYVTTRYHLTCPPPEHLTQRLDDVCTVLHLIFNEGYAATSGNRHIRSELCDGAIRLFRVLLSLMPNETEVIGLGALMLYADSRRNARTAYDGVLIMLDEQDRSLWNGAEIAEANALLARAGPYRDAGPYQLQAQPVTKPNERWSLDFVSEHAKHRAKISSADDRRRFLSRMYCNRSRLFFDRRTRCDRTYAKCNCARSLRVYLRQDARMVGSDSSLAALYRSGKTYAERQCRELQRSTPRRTPQRTCIPNDLPCASRNRGMAT